jgi:hypothetical protein
MALAEQPSPDSRDEWTSDASNTAEKTYDPNSFYPASRDKKGFGASIRITVPPSILGEVSALVARGIIPEYRTNHDFFRDAIVHRLHYVSDMIRDENMQRVATSTAMDAEAQYYLDLMTEEDNFVKKVEEMCRRAQRLPREEEDEAYAIVRDMIRRHPSTRVKREAMKFLPHGQSS